MLAKRQQCQGEPPPEQQQPRPGLVLSNSLASSSSSSSSSTSPAVLDNALGGFQWLKISSSWEERVEKSQNDDDSPLVMNNRSCHSQGSPYGYNNDNDADDGNYYRPRRSSWGLHHNHRHHNERHHNKQNRRRRLRSRSESPTTLMGNGRRQERSLSPLPPPTTTRRHNCSMSHRRDNSDGSGDFYKLKNARDALEGSISAVINYLKTAGVPKPR